MRMMLRRLAVVAALAGLVLAVAAPASARVFVGFGFGFPGAIYYPPPVFYPPPVYYAPPAYYPPPPVGYAPPGAYGVPPTASATGQSCIVEGTALCPMERPTATGSTCWCTTPGGRVYGQAR